MKNLEQNSNRMNNLIHSNSPYLLQHANNPVEWQQWEAKTWQMATDENLLVLVSIGYSTCHWCHVMEHESFEDLETANIMNSNLISIKVDREERPDIDMVYMDACQLITGRGGWPLNVICLPDGRPIYAGTYFPKLQWQEIVIQLAAVHSENPSSTQEYATRVFEQLEKRNATNIVSQTTENISRIQLLEMYQTLSSQFDWVEGGRNRCPKFPLPGHYEFVLDHHLLSGDESAKDFLHLSLLKMSNGGIYDALRGGFCRYSTDSRWFAPHFEKMLYDNAQLISLYARAFAWSKAPVYETIARDTIDFCLRELQLPLGGFGSALDADSEGIEGKFYVFTYDTLLTCLSEDELALATIQFGITKEGNWEHGYNILHQAMAPLQVLASSGLDVSTYHSRLSEIKQKLRSIQDARIRPIFDNKAICAWNGLMLKALANAAFYLEDIHFTNKAEELGHWIWDTFWKEDQLYRIHCLGHTKIGGFLEDYACLCEGYLALYVRVKSEYCLIRAEQLIAKAIVLFYNSETQQLAFTPINGETLIIRKSDYTDDVIPSPNGILAHCLFQLGTIRNNIEYLHLAKVLAKQVQQNMIENPGWYFNWARLAQAHTLGGIHIRIEGEGIPPNDICEMASKLPSWTVVQFAENTELCHIIPCVANTCYRGVSTTKEALEIVLDVCSLSGD